MDTIKIDVTAGWAQLDFSFSTPQTFFYNFEIVDAAGNQKLTGKGQWDGATSFPLGDGAALVGLYINIDWVEIDPVGAGANFAAVATVSQNGTACPNVQNFTGTSTATSVLQSTAAQFTV